MERAKLNSLADGMLRILDSEGAAWSALGSAAVEKPLRELTDIIRRTPKPAGVRALFVGPAGASKTTAAQVVAQELGLQLFLVDLSRVASKYIGETEKNLERVFTAAERAGAVLFFDEADALFGERSDVRDEHDRYENLDVADLLQRIEGYEGLVILASNLRPRFDPALLKRFTAVVDFAVRRKGA